MNLENFLKHKPSYTALRVHCDGNKAMKSFHSNAKLYRAILNFPNYFLTKENRKLSTGQIMKK